VRNARLWERLLGVERTVVDGVVFDEDDEAIVASVRPGGAPPGAAASASAAARGVAGLADQLDDLCLELLRERPARAALPAHGLHVDILPGAVPLVVDVRRTGSTHSPCSAPHPPPQGDPPCLILTFAARSTAPRSPTSPASYPTAPPTRSPSSSAPSTTRIAIMTGPQSRKARNLQADPRVVLSLTATDDPFQPVIVRGKVVEWVHGDAAWEIVDRIAAKYTDHPYTRARTRRRPHRARPADGGEPMILITGGLGSIGSHTARALLDLGRVRRPHRAPVHPAARVPRRRAQRPGRGRAAGHNGRADLPRHRQAARDHRHRAPRGGPLRPARSGRLPPSRHPRPAQRTRGGDRVGRAGGSPSPTPSACTRGGPRSPGARTPRCR